MGDDEAQRRAQEEAQKRAAEEARRQAEAEALRKAREIKEAEDLRNRSMLCPHGNIIGQCAQCR